MRDFLRKPDSADEEAVTPVIPDEEPTVETPAAEAETDVESPAPVGAEIEVPAEEESPPENEHYTIGTFKGRPNYQCRYCAFATVDGERAVNDHIWDRHLRPQSQKRSVLLGPTGNPL